MVTSWPQARWQEFIEVEGNGCWLARTASTSKRPRPARRWRSFALPGAFTPTCSAQHVPGYMEKAEALGAAGVDEIWCVSVNDAFVMGAWGREQKTAGRPHDGATAAAEFTKATGLTLDLTARGMGLRSQRYSMLVVDGVVKTLNIEAPGKFEVSDADTMLKREAQGLLAPTPGDEVRRSGAAVDSGKTSTVYCTAQSKASPEGIPAAVRPALRPATVQGRRQPAQTGAA